MKAIRASSDAIRKNIGQLIYEQQLFQQAENDDAVERTQVKIDKLRCQLLLVVEIENSKENEEEDQG